MKGLDATITSRNTLATRPRTPRFVETLPLVVPFHRSCRRGTSQTTRARNLLTLAGVLTAVLALLFGLNLAGTRDRLSGGPVTANSSLGCCRYKTSPATPLRSTSVDGIPSMTTDLGKIGALRGSRGPRAMQYKGTRKALPKIGRS